MAAQGFVPVQMMATAQPVAVDPHEPLPKWRRPVGTVPVVPLKAPTQQPNFAVGPVVQNPLAPNQVQSALAQPDPALLYQQAILAQQAALAQQQALAQQGLVPQPYVVGQQYAVAPPYPLAQGYVTTQPNVVIQPYAIPQMYGMPQQFAVQPPVAVPQPVPVPQSVAPQAVPVPQALTAPQGQLPQPPVPAPSTVAAPVSAPATTAVPPAPRMTVIQYPGGAAFTIPAAQTIVQQQATVPAPQPGTPAPQTVIQAPGVATQATPQPGTPAATLDPRLLQQKPAGVLPGQPVPAGTVLGQQLPAGTVLGQPQVVNPYAVQPGLAPYALPPGLAPQAAATTQLAVPPSLLFNVTPIDPKSPPPGTLGRTYLRQSRMVPHDKHPRCGMLDVEIIDSVKAGLDPRIKIKIITRDIYNNFEPLEGFTGDDGIWHFESEPLLPTVPHIYDVRLELVEEIQTVEYMLGRPPITKISEKNHGTLAVKRVRLIPGRIVDLMVY